MKPRKRIIDPQEAQQRLAVNNGNAKKTALEMGISRSGLRAAVGRMTQATRGRMHIEASPELVEETAGKWKRLMDKSLDIAYGAMLLQGPEQLMEMKAKDIREFVVSSAVATEKHRLVTGAATSRIEVADLASFLKNSTETGTAAAPAAAPTPIHVLRGDKTG